MNLCNVDVYFVLNNKCNIKVANKARVEETNLNTHINSLLEEEKEKSELENHSHRLKPPKDKDPLLSLSKRFHQRLKKHLKNLKTHLIYAYFSTSIQKIIHVSSTSSHG